MIQNFDGKDSIKFSCLKKLTKNLTSVCVKPGDIDGIVEVDF